MRDACQFDEETMRVPTRSLHSIASRRGSMSADLASTGGQWTAYASGFLQPNVALDESTTRRTRTDAVEGILLHTTFYQGDALVVEGHKISESQLAGIGALREYFSSRSTVRLWHVTVSLNSWHCSADGWP